MVVQETPASAAMDHLRGQLALGRPWAEALLEAVGLWTAPDELFHGRRYTYLVEGEAFDWLLLAERLLGEVPDTVPVEERERLLFSGDLPSTVTLGAFQAALGEVKYQAYLNFFYGVVVEEALVQAVEEEVIKERGVRGLNHRLGVDDLVMQRLYGGTEEALLKRFVKEHGWRWRKTLNLGQWKAFTYWRFKLRVGRSDQSRLASDTRKGLRQLSAAYPAEHSSVAMPVHATASSGHHDQR